MLTLIVGGSAGNKSELAEQYITEYSKKHHKPLIYLATMKVYGEEGRKRVVRHRLLRQGKGFYTIEQEKNLNELILSSENVVLLEDIPNLLANYMFDENKQNIVSMEQIRDEIVELGRKVSSLYVVSGDVFRDGTYDGVTEDYRRNLGKLNRLLAQEADQVIEVVAGCPLIWKSV